MHDVHDSLNDHIQRSASYHEYTARFSLPEVVDKVQPVTLYLIRLYKVAFFQSRDYPTFLPTWYHVSHLVC